MILDGLPRYFSNKIHPQSLSALLVAPEFSVLSSIKLIRKLSVNNQKP